LAESRSFSGSGRPRWALKPSEKAGGFAPHLFGWFQRPPGPPRPRNRPIFSQIQNPPLLNPPLATAEQGQGPEGGPKQAGRAAKSRSGEVLRPLLAPSGRPEKNEKNTHKNWSEEPPGRAERAQEALPTSLYVFFFPFFLVGRRGASSGRSTPPEQLFAARPACFGPPSRP